jgi:hypothetical protein
VQQHRDHLGVGLRREGVALALEALFQREVVLDDPVVDDDERGNKNARGAASATGVSYRIATRSFYRRAARQPLSSSDFAAGAE